MHNALSMCTRFGWTTRYRHTICTTDATAFVSTATAKVRRVGALCMWRLAKSKPGISAIWSAETGFFQLLITKFFVQMPKWLDSLLRSHGDAQSAHASITSKTDLLRMWYHWTIGETDGSTKWQVLGDSHRFTTFVGGKKSRGEGNFGNKSLNFVQFS